MGKAKALKGPGGLPYRPCVGVMLVNPAGLVFAGQRKDSAVPAWQMPQGGIDDGEQPVRRPTASCGRKPASPATWWNSSARLMAG